MKRTRITLTVLIAFCMAANTGAQSDPLASRLLEGKWEERPLESPEGV